MRGSKDNKKQALKAVIIEAFDQITADREWDLPARLIYSMFTRIQAVYDAQGWQTKY